MMAVALQARQRIREVREILKHDHGAALNELEEIFREGIAPESLLDGRFSGQIITATYQPSLNALVRFVITAVIPWKGSSFDIETGSGENSVASGLGWLVRRLAGDRGCIPTENPNRVDAFGFQSYFGTSLHYPGQEVLVADYCMDGNPALVRCLLSEIVEI